MNGDGFTLFEQPLDRLRDLKLASTGGFQSAHRLVDARLEEVDPDESEVGGRIDGLLDEANDSLPVELDDAVGLRVLDRRHHDLSGTTRLLEVASELPDAVSQHVVPEVHDEGLLAEELARDQHGVGKTSGRVLLDVGDLQT